MAPLDYSNHYDVTWTITSDDVTGGTASYGYVVYHVSEATIAHELVQSIWKEPPPPAPCIARPQWNYENPLRSECYRREPQQPRAPPVEMSNCPSPTDTMKHMKRIRTALRRFRSWWRWRKCKSGIHGPFRGGRLDGTTLETECVVCGAKFEVEIDGKVY